MGLGLGLVGWPPPARRDAALLLLLLLLLLLSPRLDGVAQREQRRQARRLEAQVGGL